MLSLALALLLAADPAPKIALRLTADGQAFEAVGLAKAIAAPGATPPPDWSRHFRVVVKQDHADAQTLPLLGEYSATKETVRFTPRFPPVPGVTYRLTVLLVQKPIVSDIAIPKLDPTPRTCVTAIYPSANLLPENTLRFYVQFSGPMNRKDIYRHVSLVGSDGKPVEYPFLELEEQLWSKDGTRLTLLCDPGRVKRGLVPREQDGPILEEGKRYTLAIDRGWEDADGRLMKETARMTFDVGPPDDMPVDPANWSLMSPTKGSANPLIIRLAKPLDRGLLARMLSVEDASGRPVDGAITVGGGERVVTFAPAKPWTAGTHRLLIDTRLEDVCGNRVGQPFEVDVFKTVQQKLEVKTTMRKFEVR